MTGGATRVPSSAVVIVWSRTLSEETHPSAHILCWRRVKGEAPVASCSTTSDGETAGTA